MPIRVLVATIWPTVTRIIAVCDVGFTQAVTNLSLVHLLTAGCLASRGRQPGNRCSRAAPTRRLVTCPVSATTHRQDV